LIFSISYALLTGVIPAKAGTQFIEAEGSQMPAITREKRIKKWNRAWKLKLIEDMNPQWKDLYEPL
jgi:predicted GIY-YIG superfamily endonuclease